MTREFPIAIVAIVAAVAVLSAFWILRTTPATDGFKDTAGAATATCVDECAVGPLVCDGDQLLSCYKAADGCTHWASATCTYGCVKGVCKSNP